jgi:hypothetical protein
VKNSGVLIIVAAVVAVGGIWLYTRSRVPTTTAVAGGGSGGFLSGLENLGVSTGVGLANQGVSAGVGALSGALSGSGSDGSNDDGSSDDSDSDS